MTMKYARHIRHNQDAEDLEATLKEAGFNSSLLNYAEVIANVLSGEGYLNKRFPGFKRVDIRDRIKQISDLEKKCSQISEDPIISYFYSGELPFKPIIDRFEKILSELKEFLLRAGESPLFPGLNMRPRPIGIINQILIMWIPGMTDKYSAVHWQDLKEMSLWFSKRLSKTEYSRKITPSSLNIKALQTLYARLTKNIPMFKYSSAFEGYVKIWNVRPQIGLTHGGIAKSFYPIRSIEFYPNRIKTIFVMNEAPFVRETVFVKGRAPSSTIHAHNATEEDSENIILEIPVRRRGRKIFGA